MSCQNRKQMERKPEMEVQEESINNDKIKTFCTEKKDDKSNHMSEVNGNRMHKRGLLESYQNGNSILTTQNVVLFIYMCFVHICPVTGLSRACLASISTMKFVNECPKSPEDAHKRAIEMNCCEKPQNCTSPDKFKYHCLKLAQKDEYVEVCAPVTLISCHCAIYDPIAGVPQMDNENRYQGTLENCTYYSNMYHEKGCSGIFETFNSTEKSINISMPCPEKKTNTVRDSTEDNDVLITVAVVCSIIVAVLVGTIIFFLKLDVCRNTARRQGFNGPENQNNQRMQFENLLRLEEQQ